MADEENIISFGAKQETLAEERRSVRIVNIIPMTWYFIHISCKSSFPFVHSGLIHPIVLFLIEVHHLCSSHFNSRVCVTIVIRAFPPSILVLRYGPFSSVTVTLFHSTSGWHLWDVASVGSMTIGFLLLVRHPRCVWLSPGRLTSPR